jgi:hypothetical protein
MRLWVKGHAKRGRGCEAVSKNIGFLLPLVEEKENYTRRRIIKERRRRYKKYVGRRGEV